MTTITDMQRVDQVRAASRTLGASSRAHRDDVLRRFAAALRRDAAQILATNADDVLRATEAGISDALIDRLTLDEARLESIAAAVEDIAALDDPLGEILLDRTLPNGLHLQQRRVPFGVVCVVYEARPNVTADAAAIAIKTGNGIVLRGSRQAEATNQAIAERLEESLEAAGFARDAIWNFPPEDRDRFRELIAQEDGIDLVIPRGGEALKRFLLQHARVPVLAAAGGNCHIYVDESADLDMAIEIVLNAKTQRPGVCNAAETLLVHRSREADALPALVAALEAAGVEIRTDEASWDEEFLDLIMSVRVVDDVDAAVEHINHHGTGHSEAIITATSEHAERFVDGVDSAAVYVNASTRFTDGGVYGLGAEVGISTNKLHARGPIGLRELTTTKYVARGTGQVR
jgi:glutamate-5-semialdehyde dehydrogenase